MKAVKTESKDGRIRWRIKTLSQKHRYFTQKDIDGQLLREKIANTSLEELRKRNNVEATIFQLGYHYPNDKSRYRGLVKHQMWANIRCVWVNFVRIAEFTVEKACATAFGFTQSRDKVIILCTGKFCAFSIAPGFSQGMKIIFSLLALAKLQHWAEAHKKGCFQTPD